MWAEAANVPGQYWSGFHFIDISVKDLEAIESWSEIQTIVPGEIKPCRGSGSGLRLNVKYKTAAGLKVLAKNNSSVQEVFFASNSPDALVSKLQAHKP